MRKRAILISRHDYWPGITPEKLWELPAHLWPQLALSCDALTAERQRVADEIERKSRG